MSIEEGMVLVKEELRQVKTVWMIEEVVLGWPDELEWLSDLGK